MEKGKLSLTDVLESFWLRVIRPTDDMFEDCMQANEFEKTETGKLFSIEEQGDNEDEEFTAASGDCFYCDSVEEFLAAFNQKLSNGDYTTEAPETSEEDSAE